jgi:glutamyl-tRNA reductase
MLTGLKLWNFNSGVHPEGEMSVPAFVLKTCQRTLVVSFEDYPFKKSHLPINELYEGDGAYLFLLETICGLKSKLIGENEIVGQFKEAYKNYVQSLNKNSKLIQILEKLFKDAKDIRTEYLIGISQKTYASLTRKHLIQKAKAKQIVIVGSGQLAEDLINQFKKKAEVILCARNHERVQFLARNHDLKIIPWEKRAELVNYAFIANTIGADLILFDSKFFEIWSKNNSQHMFVDLGSPSIIDTNKTMQEGVIRLDDIFSEGAIIEVQKQQQIELARSAMMELTKKRKSLFEAKLIRSNILLSPQITTDVRYI